MHDWRRRICGSMPIKKYRTNNLMHGPRKVDLMHDRRRTVISCMNEEDC
jgi:hypothetical protein